MTTAREYLEHLKQEAIQAFEGHVLRASEERHWSIGRPGTGVYFAEVFAGAAHLYVGGDIDTVAFGYYLDGGDPLAMLRWIGCTDDVGWYIKQKAGIGLSDSGRLTEGYDDEVARSELGMLLREDLEDPDAPGAGKRIRMLQEAMDYTHDEVELRGFLYEETDDPELASDIGQVCSPRVVYAWAAVRRLCELLELKPCP